MKKSVVLGVFLLALFLAWFAGEVPSNSPDAEVENDKWKQNQVVILPEEETEPEPVKENEAKQTDSVEEEKKETISSREPEQEPSAQKIEDPIDKSRTDSSNEEREETPDSNTKNHEPEQKVEQKCSLSVRCDDVFEKMEDLKEGKESILPTDGIIYPTQWVEFSEGESVFDVLHRELKKKKIPLEFVKTPMYQSVYIEGIGNLYEFDCGSYSGWTYRVNGEKPPVGSSQYQVKPGDEITFYFTCNFMEDN